MEIDALTTLLVNSGVTVTVVAFFMYRDLKFMDELQSTLVTLVDTVSALKDVISKNIEE